MTNETLEEAAEHNYPNGDIWTEEQAVIRRLAFKNGAKWQAERMFSDEEVIDLLAKFRRENRGKDSISFKDIQEWFKQFKKNDMKQTAVEWLMLEKALVGYIDDEMVEQASELFEQQIKDAYVYGFKECEKIHEEVFFIQDLSDDYYLQTFKKDKL